MFENVQHSGLPVDNLRNNFSLARNVIKKWHCLFLSAFAKLRIATVRFVMSVRPLSICSHWADFHEIWYLSIFRKSVEQIQVSSKSDKIKGYGTWRPIYIFDHISLSFFLAWKYFRAKVVEKLETRILFWCFADRASPYIYRSINQFDALNFIMSLFHASTCFEHVCSKHVEAWNELIIKFSASSWLIVR